jgi:hypothetical protein
MHPFQRDGFAHRAHGGTEVFPFLLSLEIRKSKKALRI